VADPSTPSTQDAREHFKRRKQDESDRRGPLAPRLLSVAAAAGYLGVSEDQVVRLVNNGVLSLVRLPAGRTDPGAPTRRLLLDRLEIDELVPKWREKRGGHE
jgi:excisionase family DNA binding protein